jgi:hypothetical protein
MISNALPRVITKMTPTIMMDPTISVTRKCALKNIMSHKNIITICKYVRVAILFALFNWNAFDWRIYPKKVVIEHRKIRIIAVRSYLWPIRGSVRGLFWVYTI